MSTQLPTNPGKPHPAFGVAKVPLPACGESSAAGGFPAVGDWRSRSVPKAYPEGEGLGVGFCNYG